MRLTRIQATNFVSWEDLDLDLSGVDMAVIVGANGAGKSSLFDMVTWCLYGRCRASLIDSVVRRKPTQQDGCTVQVSFTANGHEVVVERERVSKGRGRTNLRLWVDGVDKTRYVKGATTSEDVDKTQAAINRCVGVGYEALMSGPFMRQNESGAFMELKPTARRELLMRVFELERFVPWHEAAKSKARAAEQAVDRLDGWIADAERQLEGAAGAAHDLEGAKAVLAEATVERDQWQDAYASAKTSLDALRERQVGLHALSVERDALLTEAAGVDTERRYMEGRLQRARESLDTLPDMDTEPDRSVEDVDAALSRARDQNGDRVRAERELAALDGRIYGATSHPATCPTCGTGFDCLGTLDLAALGRERDEAWRRYEALPVADTAALETERARLSRLWDVWRQRLDARDALEAFGVSLAGVTTRAAAVAERLVAVEEDIKARSEERAAIATATTALAGVEAGLAQRRAVVERATRDVGRAEERVATMHAMAERLAERQAERKGEAERAEGFRVLASAFHVTGIPGAIMGAGLDLIEDRANELLDRLPGDFEVRLRTERDKRSGPGSVDTLEPMVLSDGVELEYEMLSGAERFRVDLALRMGFSAVLAQRTGSGVRLETLFLDEPLAPVDAAGREAVVDALGVAAPGFPLMLVVSHHPDFDDRAPTIIEVTKNDEGVSHVRVH